jgi:hypothetical protein
MKRIFDVLMRCVALLLVCALLAPPPAFAAPKKTNPETIHDKIVKRGIGNWVCVEMNDGVLLTGRVSQIDLQQFGLQVDSYGNVRMVPYADVVRLRNMTLSGKGMAWVIVAGVGGTVAFALIAHHEFEKNKPTLPTTPTPTPWP